MTYAHEDEARAAIAALSDKYVLPGATKALVVRFAEGLQQRMEEGKLQIGMLPLDVRSQHPLLTTGPS